MGPKKNKYQNYQVRNNDKIQTVNETDVFDTQPKEEMGNLLVPSVFSLVEKADAEIASIIP